MGKGDDVVLNSVFVKNRIAELGIKQWWLAEQIGVDRKTVVRWVQGRVKSIQKENAASLAKILNCSVEDLTHFNLADQVATIQDQKTAAALLVSSSLIEKLGPIGEWNVVESLLKATLVPDLPLNILGELYNQLCVASWRQSKLDQAELFNQKAEEIAEKTGDKQVLAAALLSKANLLSWRGKIGEATRVYHDCVTLERFIEPKSLAGAYSNLGAVLYESGDFAAGETFENKAIELFSVHGKPVNLSIAWCHLALLNLRKGSAELALSACEKSADYATQDDYRRGLAMCELIRAEVFALQNKMSESLVALANGLQKFEQLGIEEGLNYEFAGRVHRLVGRAKEAIQFLKKGISISAEFPMSLASLHFEMAKVLSSDPANRIAAVDHAKTSIKLFETCGAPLKASEVKNLKDSIA